MGNLVGGMPMQDIQRESKRAMEIFTKNYLKAFAIELLKDMERKRDGEEADNLLLLSPPIPSEPLKMGWVTKLGAARKNWKERWFIAGNAADDFTIYYYKKETEQIDEKAAQGTINLSGYRVKRVAEEDAADYGDYCLILYPFWNGERRRTWYLRFESEKEMEEWEGVLKYAAPRAPAPLNKDPVLREAFKQAYRRTRWELWIWGWYTYCTPEAEMLGQLVVDMLEDTVMRPVYAKVSNYRMRRFMQSQLDTTVGSVVGTGWKTVSKKVVDIKPDIEAKAEEKIGPVLDKKAELMQKVQDAISDKVNPAVSEICSPVLKPLVEAMINPLYNAEKVAIRMWHEKMSEIIKTTDTEQLNKKLTDFIRDCRWYWGCLHDSFKKIYALTRYDNANPGGVKLKIPIDAIIEMLGDVSMWRLEDHLENVIRKLIKDAVYTYQVKVKDGAENGEELLTEVLGKLVHDAKVHGRKEMGNLLFEVVNFRIEKDVMPKLTEVLSPIKELIPDALEQFLDVDDMAGKIVSGVVEGACYSALDPIGEPVFSQLDELAPNGVPSADNAAAAPTKAEQPKATEKTTAEKDVNEKTEETEEQPTENAEAKDAAAKTEEQPTAASKTTTNDPEDGPVSRPKSEVAA